MTTLLPLPDAAQARRLLATVPYGERFPAGRLRPPVGIIPGTIRSLSELHRLLEPDVQSLPGINLTALPEWIARTVGDPELAGAVRSVTGEAASYVARCLAVHDLVGRRLTQARTVAGEEEMS